MGRAVGGHRRSRRGYQFQRGRRGVGVTARSTRRRGFAQYQRRGVHFLHAQLAQAEAEPHDVNQRVHAAQLFQFQRLFRLAVNPRLSFPQRAQHQLGLLPHRGVESAVFYGSEQGGGGMAGAVFQPDLEVGAADFAAGFLRGVYGVAADGELGQLAAQHFQREASVDQRAQQHIAAGSANGLNIGNLH